MAYTRNPSCACSRAALTQCNVAGSQLKQANGHGAGNTLSSAARIHLELMFKKGGIMLQASDVQKRLTHLQQTVGEAFRTCHADATIPKDLMKWVDELDNECKSAKKVMSSHDEGRIRQWVDDLERIGDRAERACQQASGLDARVMDAVSSVHSELSDLQRRLH